MANVNELGSKRFKRRKEDFECEMCGFEVKGTGYTDHCPNCLYSKHVDVNPGDRKSDCKGLMEPINAEYKKSDFLIHYKCIKCNFKHHVHSAENDNKGLLFRLAA